MIDAVSNRMKSLSPTNTSFTLVAVALSSALCASALSYWLIEKRRSNEIAILKERRQEERTGRIRAEIKLRTALKECIKQTSTLDAEVESLRALSSSPSSSPKSDPLCMQLRAIGKIVSPYTKRMGTPRQPQLVPSSRGFIDLDQVPQASVVGITDYSHIWIIFEFHANTDLNTTKRTKIRPPRGGGIKVGQLATRSPHRPNPIGLSLVKVEKWDETNRRLYISGLDLVHGTPVFDIKPCVPWDIPGYPDRPDGFLKVPEWVSQDDELSEVEFTDQALQQLQRMVIEGRLEPLYTSENHGFEGARQTLTEVLSQDPRSSHKGLKENARGTARKNGEREDSTYKLVFGKCQIEFLVEETEGNRSFAKVTDVVAIDFHPDSFVDGVPLMSEPLAFNETLSS
jgi:tRNA-Thr(GGU) m(6)t(6)A37 methyltransferase TsaA